MWIKFKNNVVVNLDNVLTIIQGSFGHRLTFQGIGGYAIELAFADKKELEMVKREIFSTFTGVGFKEIDVEATIC